MIKVKEKEKIIDLLKNGESIKDIRNEYNIAKSTLYKWKKDYTTIKSKYADSKVTPDIINKLKSELERALTENEILRKCKLINEATTKEKIESIYHLRNHYSVNILCSALAIRRSTFYYYERTLEQGLQVEKEDVVFKKRIEEIFYQSKEIFGARKIRVIMMKEGYTISPARISKLMKEMNLICKPLRPKIEHKLHPVYFRNKLSREFTQAAPNLAWVSDTSVIPINKKAFYLLVIIDLFSRKVIGYTMENNQSSSIIIQLFKKTYLERGSPKNLVFHSDQGALYTAYKTRKVIRELGVTLSFSNKGTPLDNAVAERFFSSLKNEELHHHYFTDSEDCKKTIDEYIYLYNNYRPHEKLNYLTPNEIENEYYLPITSEIHDLIE